MIAGYYTSRI